MKMRRRLLSVSFAISGLLIGAPGLRADVATYRSEDEPERPVVMLELNRITDDDDPIGAFAPYSAQRLGGLRLTAFALYRLGKACYKDGDLGVEATHRRTMRSYLPRVPESLSEARAFRAAEGGDE